LSGELAAAGANLASEVTTAEVVQALAAAGVTPVVLKGPWLAAWLGDTTRASTDVDLLIAPAEGAAAAEVLAALGFRPLLPERGEPLSVGRTWEREPSQVRVDLHTTIVGATADADLVVAALADHTETVMLGGGEARIAAGAARLLLLALHAAQHGVREPAPLRDLERGIELASVGEWRRAAELAEQIGATEAFAAGLRLVPAGAALADELALVRTWSPIVALRSATPPHTAFGFDRLAETRGLGRLRLVAHELVPSPSFMRDWFPTARRGRLGLVLAYLYRPLWLAWWAPRGYLAWRRAKRVADSGHSHKRG
jgi:hypothetical protein